MIASFQGGHYQFWIQSHEVFQVSEFGNLPTRVWALIYKDKDSIFAQNKILPWIWRIHKFQAVWMKYFDFADPQRRWLPHFSLVILKMVVKQHPRRTALASYSLKTAFISFHYSWSDWPVVKKLHWKLFIWHPSLLCSVSFHKAKVASFATPPPILSHWPAIIS